MRIMVGTNFLEEARKAVDVAAAFAARNESPLTLVHAVEPGPIEFMEKHHINLLRKRLQQKLQSEGARLRKSGVNVSEKLVLRSPTSALPEMARRETTGMIIVASQEQAAPFHQLGGGLAERIAQKVDVPTLAVRDSQSLLSWARGEKPLNVFVGYDFSTSSDAALRWVESLKKIGPLQITVAYVSWPPNETVRFGIGGDTSIPGNTPEVQALVERDLAEKCRAVFGGDAVKTRVIANWTREHFRLIELASEDHADLIVVGTNRRTGLNRFWLGSVSRAVLRHAATNVACVPMSTPASAEDQKVEKFERILVPTDMSPAGDNAVALAFSAATAGSEVCLLHVVSPIGGFRSKDPNRRSPRARMRKRVSRELQRLIPAESEKRGLRHRVEIVEHEHPSIAICQAAERFAADLICLGWQKKSPWRKKIFGSTTRSVMRRSSRPVLVIHS